MQSPSSPFTVVVRVIVLTAVTYASFRMLTSSAREVPSNDHIPAEPVVGHELAKRLNKGNRSQVDFSVEPAAQAIRDTGVRCHYFGNGLYIVADQHRTKQAGLSYRVGGNEEFVRRAADYRGHFVVRRTSANSLGAIVSRGGGQLPRLTENLKADIVSRCGFFDVSDKAIENYRRYKEELRYEN